MAGHCFKYKGVMVLWNSGLGNPNYEFTVYPKGSRDKNGFLKTENEINFGYNIKENYDKNLNRVKKYIDVHKKELMGCRCGKQCEITKRR